jgi:phosphopentomutase
MDGCGVGGAPDAAAFGDLGSDTLANIAELHPLHCPELARLGLGNLYAHGLPGLPRVVPAAAHHARLTEISAGKDSTTGHWELMGLVREQASPLFPHGFPQAVLDQLSAFTGRAVLGNKVASGTAIIDELAEQQLASGKWIVYTSADSVLQIAAHTSVIPLHELYRGCEIARGIMQGPQLGVDRVIARPYTGNAQQGYTRTADRKDYSLLPPGPTVLDELLTAGLEVIGVGKIGDLFAGRGLSRSYPEHGNAAQMAMTSAVVEETDWTGLLFVNLVDFDMLFGHRNDPAGYAAALEDFDSWLGPFLAQRSDDELVLITSDHGNDPTTPSTDHSREQVPLLLFSKAIEAAGGRLIVPPAGFQHVGATVLAQLGLRNTLGGVSLIDH